MKRWPLGVAAALLLGVLITAIVFAVWASVGDAPWEKTTTCAAATPCPSLSQEESEKIACLQGGGNWIWGKDEAYCGGSGTCWACVHPIPSNIGNLNN